MKKNTRRNEIPTEIPAEFLQGMIRCYDNRANNHYYRYFAAGKVDISDVG